MQRLDVLATATAERLKPWQQLEQANGRHEHDMAAIANGVEETREYIADRPAELAAFLGLKVEDEDENTPAAAAPMPPGRGSIKAGTTIHVGKSRLVAGALVTHLWLGGSGLARQTATAETAGGSMKACAAQATVAGPGPETLECQLHQTVLQGLSQHGLTLRVRTRFIPRSGSPETILRRVRLDRIPAA